MSGNVDAPTGSKKVQSWLFRHLPLSDFVHRGSVAFSLRQEFQ